MSSSNEPSDESMPTFNSTVEGSQGASLDKSLSPIESESPAPMEDSPMEASPMEDSPMKDSPMEASPMEDSPMDTSPMDASPMDASPMDASPMDASPMKDSPMEASPELPSPEESPEEEAAPSVEEEPLGEPVVSESKQMDKDKKMVDEAASFRRKLTNTKKRLPTMDDHQKDEIRNGVINEFINILKISKRATTRKKLGRRINNLRNVFNETLDLLNGTAKKHPKKRKTKKQVLSEVPPAETFSENQS
jgi:hypothetical protein